MGFFLVAGRHRLEAVRKLKHEYIECRVLDGLSADQARLAEIDENLLRADLTPSERATHHAERKKLYLKLHPETEKGKAGGRPPKTSDKMAEVSTKGYARATAKKSGKASRTVARDVARAEAIDPKALADLNGTCLDKGDQLDALAKMPKPEQRKLAKRAKAGEKVSAKTKVKQLRRADREKELAKKIIELPDVKAGVISADPAWPTEFWSEEGMDRAAENHYPCSSLEEIQELPVLSIAADDCVLFLWATVPLEDEAHKVMKAWGFDYCSQFIWVKPSIGTGRWNRNQHEILLVGTKGSPPAPADGTQFSSVIEAPRGKHSEKPDKAFEIMEAYFPNVPKIELNCRGKPRPGWSAWGNEAETEAETAKPAPKKKRSHSKKKPPAEVTQEPAAQDSTPALPEPMFEEVDDTASRDTIPADEAAE
jgi:N6-adenosine-specific RNA methylase IME4